MDVKKFVIIAQARSGSTLLRRSLHAHPELVGHGEVLSRKWIKGLVPLGNPSLDRSPKDNVKGLLEERDENVTAFLECHVFNFDARAVGFKLIYEDLFLSEMSQNLIEYIKKSKISVIHLTRDNPLATLVSRKRMGLFGITHSDANQYAESVNRPVSVTLDEVKCFIEKQCQFKGALNSVFPDALRVSYERIVYGYRNILGVLGVNVLPMDVKLEKVNQNSLSPPVSG